MSIDEKLQKILDSDAVNEPLKLEMAGTSGVRPKISSVELAKRNFRMEEMLLDGSTSDEMIDEFTSAKFEMTKTEILALKRRICNEWNEHDREFKKYNKNIASRRILKSLVAAKKCRQFNAVAALENILMKVQGTEETRINEEPVSQRITAAVFKILGETDDGEYNKLVDKGIMYKKLEVSIERKKKR